MVEKLSAYRTADGLFFASEREALEHDTRKRLDGCIGQACTVEIMKKLLGVYVIIGPLAQFLDEQSCTAGDTLPEVYDAHRQ